VQSRRESDPGFRTELENLGGSVNGKDTSGRAVRPESTDGPSRGGLLRNTEEAANFRGGKGAGHPRQDQNQRITGGTRGGSLHWGTRAG
jgi:hypothetical protein